MEFREWNHQVFDKENKIYIETDKNEKSIDISGFGSDHFGHYWWVTKQRIIQSIYKITNWSIICKS